VRAVEFETRFGRLSGAVAGDLARTLRAGERVKSAGFLAIEARLATLDPHSRSNDLANIACRRSAANGDLINAYTEYEDVVREGARAEAAVAAAASSELASRGAALTEGGAVEDPTALRGALDAAFGGGPNWLVYDPGADKASLGEAELEVAERVRRYNAKRDDWRVMIEAPFLLEVRAGAFAHVYLDDVLVHRQTRMRLVRRNGQWVTRSQVGDWIFHSVARVEADGLAIILEARSQAALLAQVLAALLANGLEGRTLVFFTDGEESLREGVEATFADWPHQMWLDYYHVTQNLKGRLSMALRPGKVIDDTVKPKRFKNGKVKKSTVKRITRSKYHLRVLKACLWAGNVEGAIDYLRWLLRQEGELKAGGAEQIEGAISYLERKGARIPCYAIRWQFGLPNTSNPVEIANNTLVSRRQKKKGTSWCDDGSFALSGLTRAFEEGVAEELFTLGKVSLKLREKAADRGRTTGLEWIVDPELQGIVLDEVDLLDDVREAA